MIYQLRVYWSPPGKAEAMHAHNLARHHVLQGGLPYQGLELILCEGG